MSDLTAEMFEKVKEMGYNSFEELHKAGYVVVLEGNEWKIMKREEAYG